MHIVNADQPVPQTVFISYSQYADALAYGAGGPEITTGELALMDLYWSEIVRCSAGVTDWSLFTAGQEEVVLDDDESLPPAINLCLNRYRFTQAHMDFSYSDEVRELATLMTRAAALHEAFWASM